VDIKVVVVVFMAVNYGVKKEILTSTS